MKGLNARALLGLLQLLVALGAALFLPAWTVAYWQAWVFLGVFFTATLAITLYLMEKDPALLARRVKAGPAAERDTQQKVIQALAAVAFIALFVLSALDHRFGWSAVPPWWSLAGDGLVALGLWIVFRVFRVNTFTSATIETGAGQRVIRTGPYAVVRHPMYSGALLMLLGVAPALGSAWGSLAFLPMLGVIVWRLRAEERFLSANLAGYSEYRQHVRRRLIPGLW
jgi:protein-S-isoprenylcysteine O-methyltransferase Ste14